jgi:hypothetical protein
VKKAQPMSVGFPLLLIPFAIYNIIAFLMPSVSFAEPLVRLPLVSGAEWPISLSDVLLTLGILLLLLEVMRGARPGGKFLTDHLLSLLVFGGSAAQFVMLSKFGTSTYFLLVLMAMVDFLAGIALRGRRASTVQPAPRAAVARGDAKRGDIERGEVKADDAKPDVVKGDAKDGAAQPLGTVLAELPREPASATAPAPPAVAPTPAPEMPAATSVAESVLIDPPEPKAAHPAAAIEPEPVTATEPESVEKAEPKGGPAPVPIAANAPSPQAPSPELQPSGAPTSPEPPKH